MRRSQFVLVFAAVAFVLAAAGAFLFSKRKPASASGANSGSLSSAGSSQTANPAPQETVQNNQGIYMPDDATANFLGALASGGTPDSAGRERNYVISYQVVFLRKSPAEKLPEENMKYSELQQRDPGSFAHNYFFYGEVVSGTYDPANPDVIAVRAKLDKKEVRGFLDSKKLWLEPPISPVETPSYMALKDATAIHVVPDPGSPTVLGLVQGEVVEAVGKLSFQGGQWIKAHFNGDETPRYGFIQSNDLLALTPATTNQSVVAAAEIPRQIRYSKVSLAEADRQKLSQNGFYVENVPPLKYIYVDDMADSYHDGSDGRQYFITSDLFLHAYHLIFDRMLQDVEENKLSPSVAALAADLAKATENEIKTLPATTPADVRDALVYDLFYFSVAAKLLNPSFTVPDAVRKDAEAVVSRIQKAGEEVPSAASSEFGDEDFTQYKVRGHYEKNDTLQRYFRGMMWFGRQNFLLSDRKLTLAAILIPGLLEKAQGTRTFESLDHSLGYVIGAQDKYTLAGYRSESKKVFGTEMPSANQLAVKLDENLQAFTRAVESDLPPPQIVSVQTGVGKKQSERLQMVRGLKFLGQRFTLDAYFLNQMTSPSVGSDDNRRNLPSTLDVMMLLGSKAATEAQEHIQQRQKWLNYESQTKKLEGVAQEHLVKRLTFYDEWLNALNSLFLPSASKQLFALGKPWQYKNLNAGAASWTELKHDTILYSEQSAAEMGEGDEFEVPPFSPPPPRGYIEPNPVFFQRLGQSIDQMLGRLKNSGFITDEYLDKFTTFRELASKAETISQKEVSGASITAEDFQWIESLEEQFGRPLLLPRGVDQIEPTELQMALIADVATDAVEGRVLEVATGTPQRIIVVAKDAYGGTRLTVGYVYSWYEFPSNKRWADSEWKKIIYAEDPALKKQSGVEPPGWYSMFMKNSGGAN
jgi:Protein of unknown function (DUF3160)